MGSDETAIMIPGGPRVIDVFDGNGAPSGPNCTLFSWVDRRSDVSRGRSGGGSGLRRVRRRLELSSGLWIEISGDLYWRAAHCPAPCLICIGRWKRWHNKCRRLHTSSSNRKRSPRDLRAKN